MRFKPRPHVEFGRCWSTDQFKLKSSKNSKFWKPYYWNKTALHIHQIKLHRNDFTFLLWFPKFWTFWSVQFELVSTHNPYIIGTKLNVRPRFEPQILHCLSFMHFWPLEVQKFRAHKIEPLWTRIRFSQSCFNLAKYNFYSWYLHRTDHHWMKNPMEKRKIVVIWEFILHFSNMICWRFCSEYGSIGPPNSEKNLDQTCLFENISHTWFN